MLRVPCPNCGAEVLFRSPALPSRVCDYCQTIVVRRGQSVEAVGKAAVLPFDVSPIQIGTRGRFDGQGFEVIGRVRWGWTDGSWNEWLLLFDDGRDGWLGEAMGQLMLLKERALGDMRSNAINALADGKPIEVGMEAVLDGEMLMVADAREATCIAAEGELPFPAPVGLKIFSVDFRSPSGACASLQREGEMPTLFAGRYVTFDDISATGLRAIEGWRVPAFGA